MMDNFLRQRFGQEQVSEKSELKEITPKKQISRDTTDGEEDFQSQSLTHTSQSKTEQNPQDVDLIEENSTKKQTDNLSSLQLTNKDEDFDMENAESQINSSQDSIEKFSINFNIFENHNRSTKTMTMTMGSPILSQFDFDELNENYIKEQENKVLHFCLEQMIFSRQITQTFIRNLTTQNPQNLREAMKIPFQLRLNQKLRQKIYEQSRGFYEKMLFAMNNDILRKKFAKKEFLKLKIIGQFNDGFVIATLNKNDLFILDQHACDERFNLEKFTSEVKIKSQPLAKHLITEVSLSSYQLIQNYLSMFEAYGFKFYVKEKDLENLNTPLFQVETVSLNLTNLPTSNDTQFGPSDFHNLITSLRNFDANKELQQKTRTQQELFEYLMPKKIHAVLALNACRKAVMIGKKLDSRKMRSLVDHLYKLKDPWICAHGRPTMRYLLNIQDFKDQVIDNIMPRPGGGGSNFNYMRFQSGFKPLTAVQQRMHNRFQPQIKSRTYGFDVSDDGLGISQQEFEKLCECWENRKDNQFYKNNSLGWKGEALNSLSKCADLTILTRQANSKTGFQLTYRDGNLINVLELAKETEGTTVQEFSMILFDTQMSLSNEFVDLGSCQKTVKKYWQTNAPGNQRDNLIQILNHMHSGTPFKNTAQDLINYFCQIQDHFVEVYLIRPYQDGTIVTLAKKNLHLFMNGKPADFPVAFKSLFYDIYSEFKVKPTSQPFVVVKFECTMDIAYEIQNQMDLRVISFNNETIIAQELKIKLKQFMNSINQTMAFVEKNPHLRAPIMKSITPQKSTGIQKVPIIKTNILPRVQSYTAAQQIVEEIILDEVEEFQQVQEIVEPQNLKRQKQNLMEPIQNIMKEQHQHFTNLQNNKIKTQTPKVEENFINKSQTQQQPKQQTDSGPVYKSIFIDTSSKEKQPVKMKEESLYTKKTSTYAEQWVELKKDILDQNIPNNDLKNNKTQMLTLKYGSSLVVKSNFNGQKQPKANKSQNSSNAVHQNNTESTCSKTGTPHSLNNQSNNQNAKRDQINSQSISDSEYETASDGEEIRNSQNNSASQEIEAQNKLQQRGVVHRDGKLMRKKPKNETNQQESNFKITIISKASPTKALQVTNKSQVLSDKPQELQFKSNIITQKGQVDNLNLIANQQAIEQSESVEIKQEFQNLVDADALNMSQEVYLDFDILLNSSIQLKMPEQNNKILANQLEFQILERYSQSQVLQIEEKSFGNHLIIGSMYSDNNTENQAKNQQVNYCFSFNLLTDKVHILKIQTQKNTEKLVHGFEFMQLVEVNNKKPNEVRLPPQLLKKHQFIENKGVKNETQKLVDQKYVQLQIDKITNNENNDIYTQMELE
eukprot:403370380